MKIHRSTCLTSTIAALLAPLAFAQDIRTWDGGASPDGNWANGLNWADDNAPDGNDVLNFGGILNTTTTNNLAGGALNQYRIFFNAGAGNFTLNGAGLTLFDFGGNAPKIENNSPGSIQTINLAITLDGTSSDGAGEINPVDGSLVFGTTGTVDLAGTTQLRIFGNNGNTVTFGGVISSSGNGGNNSVAINQNSTVVFGAANTYAGDTFINAGTLQFAAGGSANNSTLRLGDTSGSADATLVLAGGNTLASTVVVRPGSSGIKTIISSAGNNAINGSAFLDADVTVSTSFGSTLTFGGTTFDLKNQTLTVDGAGATAINSLITNSTGSGDIVHDGGGTLTLGNALNDFTGGVTVNFGTVAIASDGALGAASGGITLNGGTLQNTAAVLLSSTRAVILGAGGGTFQTLGTLTVPQAIAGPGSLTKTGAGTLILGGANTFTSTVIINGGTLEVNADAALGAAANAVALGGGTLNASSSFTIAASRTLALLSTPGNGLSASAGQTLSMDVEVQGPGGFTKTGAGTVQLGGATANTFEGALGVNLGVLELAKSAGVNAIPNVPVTITSSAAGQAIIRLLANEQIHDSAPLSWSINGGQSGTLDLNGFTETVGNLNISTTSTGTNPGGVNGVRTGAGGTLILNGDVTFNHNRNAGGNTGRELLLTATGTYGTTVSGGGTLDLGGVNRTFTVNTNHTQLNSNAHIDLNIVNGGIIKEGPRILVLNGSASTFTGGITINTGTVALTNTSATNTFSGGIAINAGGTLHANTPGGDSATFNRLFGAPGNSFTLNGGTFQANYGVNDRTMTDRTFTVTAAGGTFNTPGNYTAGTFVESGQTQLRLTTATSTFSGTGQITKIGGGRLTLNSASPDFSGPWVINNGTLEAQPARLGDNSATNVITVNGGNFAMQGDSNLALITLNGGALSATGANRVVNSPVSVTASSYMFPNDFSSDTNPARTITFNGPISAGSNGLTIAVNRPALDTNSGTVAFTNPANVIGGTIAIGKNIRFLSNPAGGTGRTFGSAAISLNAGHLQLRDNGAGSNGIIPYGNDVSLAAPAGIFNHGDIAGTNTLDVNRAGGSNTGNVIQLGTLTFGAGVGLLDVTGGNGYGAEFTGLTTLSGATAFNPTTANLALTGGITGDFALTKDGAGRLTIGGDWAAPTATAALNAGTLQFNSAASLPDTAGSISAANATVLAAGYAMDQAFLGSVAAGSLANTFVAALAADSANSLDFAAASLTAARLGAVGTATYTGIHTPATAGTYLLGGGGGTLVFPVANYFTGTANLDLGSNGTAPGVVALTAANDFTGSVTLSGGQLLRPQSDASLGNTANVITGNGGGIQFASGAPFDLFASRTVTFDAGGFILDTNGNDYTASAITGNGGTGAFTKVGAGVLTLSAAGTFTGATNVNGGVLAFSTPALLGATSGLGADGGTLRYTGGDTATLGKTLTLGSSVAAAAIDVAQAGGSLTIDTVISGGPAANNLALTKTGPGTLALITAVNTFTGDIVVDEGTLSITGQGNTDPTRLGGGQKSVTLNNGSIFRVTSGEYNPTANTKRLFIGATGGVFNSAGATAITLDDANQLQGTGDLVIAGGLVSLGNNYGTTYTGNITIQPGARLRTFNANANPLGDTGGTTTVLSGASLDIQSTGTNNEQVFIEGPGNNTARAALANTGTTSAVLGGPVTMTGPATMGGTSTGTLTLSNAVTGAFPLTKTGSATIALAGAGGTALNATLLDIQAGVFLLNNDGGAESTAANNPDRLADGIPVFLRGNGSALHLRGMNVTAGGTSSETVGTITVAGQGTLRASVAGGTVLTTLTASAISRQNQGVLYVQGTAAATLGVSDFIMTGIAPAVVNGMTAPWILDNSVAASTFFATYGVNGFTTATATTTDLSTALATDIADDADGAILGGPATVHALRLGGALTGGSLTISSGGLIVSGTPTHSTPVDFDGEGVVDAVTGANVVFTGLPTATALTKSGPGTVRFSNTAQRTNPGLASAAFSVHNGLLEIGDRATTNDNNGVPDSSSFLLTGGAVNFYHSQVIAGLSGTAGTVRVGANTTGNTAKLLVINQNTDAIFAGSLDSDDGNGSDASIIKQGSGTLTLTGVSRIGRTQNVNFGTLILAENATLNGAGTAPPTDRQQMAIAQGGTVILDNTSINVADRIGTNRTTTTAPLAINGGSLILLGNADAASNESFSGTFANSFGAGASTVSIVPGAGRPASITTASQFNRSAGGTVLVKGTNLGGPRGAADTASFVIGGTTALVGGGGAGDTPLRSIYKGVIANSIIGGNDTYGLSTYDVGPDLTSGNADDIGVRRLRPSEHAPAFASGDTALNNVLLSSTVSGIDAPTTINALHLAGGADITGTSTLTINSGAILAANNGAAGSNAISLATLAFGTGEAVIHTVENLAISSQITGTGGLTKAGPGTLLLGNSANSFSGGQGLTVNGGIVSAASDAALGSAANTVRLNTGGGLQATASFSSTRGIVLGAAGGVLDVLNVSDDLILSGTISGGVGTVNALGIGATTGSFAAETTVLTKTGAGTLVLGGTNTFTGLAEINGGTLEITGSLAAGAHTAVNAGGTLAGSGAIGGSATVNSGGTLAPGLSAGLLSTGSLTFNSGSTFALELNGTIPAIEYDQVSVGVSGSVSLNGGTLSLSLGFDPEDNVDVFYVILNSGSLPVSGTFAGLPEGASFSTGGQLFQITYTANWTGTQAGSNPSGGNDVALLAIPEPGSAALLLAGLGILGFRRRHTMRR